MTQSALYLTLPREDMAHILTQSEPIFKELQNACILITGGTGFFGRWMVESLLYANDQLELNATILLLTRRPQAFRDTVPALAHHPAVVLCEGDVCQPLALPQPVTHILHLATDTIQSRKDDSRPEAALESLDNIVTGTRNILELAKQQSVRHMLFTSSGAVYGKQPPEVSHLPETFTGGPNPTDFPASLYGEGKRMAELLCSLYADKFQVPVTIARCFAFLGPLLSLDGPYAIGNFIRDARDGQPISIRGDGTLLRSYLYSADLAVWLWTLLLRGTPGRPYNVGSDQAVSLYEAAQTVAHGVSPHLPVQVGQSPQSDTLPERYIPAIQRAVEELNLSIQIPLTEGVERTLNWLRETEPSDKKEFNMAQTR